MGSHQRLLPLLHHFHGHISFHMYSGNSWKSPMSSSSGSCTPIFAGLFPVEIPCLACQKLLMDMATQLIPPSASGLPHSLGMCSFYIILSYPMRRIVKSLNWCFSAVICWSTVGGDLRRPCKVCPMRPPCFSMAAIALPKPKKRWIQRDSKP